MKSAALFMAVIFAVRAAECVPVSGDRVPLSDIAGLLPLSGADPIPPVLLSWTPLPGARRILTAEELLSIVRRNGISVREAELRDICVERFTTALNEKAIRDALSHIDELAGASIDI